MSTSVRSSQVQEANRLRYILTFAAAIAAGSLIATQPPLASLIVFALALFVLLGGLHPLAVLVPVLILAPLRALILTELGASWPLPLDVGQIGILLVAVAYGIYRVARKGRLLTIQSSPLLIALGLYLGVLLLTLLDAVSLSAGMTEWLKWLLIFALVLLVLNLERHQWYWLVFGLSAAGLGHALIGLYTFLGGSGADHLVIGGGFFRAFGTFGQPNPFGALMGLLAPLTLAAGAGYAMWTWQLWARRRLVSSSYVLITLYYGLAGALISLGVFISWSRGAWLGFAAALLVMAFAIPRRLWQSTIVLVALILIGGMLWFSGLVPASITARVTSTSEELFLLNDVRGVDITVENYALVERLAHWQAAWEMARANPWLGVGFGGYDAAYPDFRLINWDLSLDHAHNYYLNVLGETGMIGLASYSSVLAVVLWMTWRVRTHPDIMARWVAVGLLGSWTYLLMHSLTDNLFVNNVFIHIGVMLGILAVLHRDVFGQMRKLRQ